MYRDWMCSYSEAHSSWLGCAVEFPKQIITDRSVCLSLSVYLSVHPSSIYCIHLSVRLSIRLSSIRLSICPSIRPSV